MTRPQLDLAAIIRNCYDAFLQRYGGSLTPQQRRALDDLAACRTAALGGHVLGCPQCGHQQIGYNSCGNRHCPKCQGTAAARWLETQAADLLDVPYFHVVLTLPRIFNPIALANPQEVYGLLMRAAAETLIEVAADPKHLGAEIGVLAVLHTWGQKLDLHPHVHCVVPGGGLSPDGTRWVSSRPNFFLPVRVLSRVFRGKFLAGLRTAFAAGRLRFPGKLASLAEPDQFNRLLSEAVRTDWVVYTQPHLGSSEVVLKYLARYTHRAAISNHRLLELIDGQVRFRWKDYARGGRWRTMTLERHRVRPPVPDARAALGLRANPPLRNPGQSSSEGKAGAVSGVPQRGGTTGIGRPRAERIPEVRRAGDSDPGVSGLWRRPDDRDQRIPTAGAGPGSSGMD